MRRPPQPPVPVSAPVATASNVAASVAPRRPGLAILRSGPKRIVNVRPTTAHPWTRFPAVAKPPPAKL